MSRLADIAWQMLQDGHSIEEVKARTQLSTAVLEAMKKDIARQYADKHRRETRR